jgi:hypothetical protein
LWVLSNNFDPLPVLAEGKNHKIGAIHIVIFVFHKHTRQYQATLLLHLSYAWWINYGKIQLLTAAEEQFLRKGLNQTSCTNGTWCDLAQSNENMKNNEIMKNSKRWNFNKRR